MNIRLKMLLLLVAAGLFQAPCSSAAENLDPAFGTQGVTITDFGVADDEASALAVQPDGKILLAGFSSNSVIKDVAVARYQSDGTLDTSFHTSGYITFNIGEGNAMARAMAVQEDGKIVVAGTFDNGANEASSEIFLARLTTEGYPDVSFGTDGKVVLSLEGKTGIAYDLQITADGNILVAGTAGDADGLQAVLARIDPHGVPDGSFAVNGIAMIERDYETAAHALVLQADDTILLAGYSKPAEIPGLCLFRLKADGTLDTSFGTEGEVQVAVEGGEAVVYDMAAQEDGRLVLVGSYDNGSYREVLLGRFMATGAADPAFGSGGLVRNDLGYDSVGYAVTIGQDNSILASGFSETDAGKDIILLRYGVQGSEVTAAETAATTEDNSESQILATVPAGSQAMTSELGSPTASSASETEVAESTNAVDSAGAADADLATASYIAESVTSYDDESRALTILADGSVLAAGYAGNGDNTDFALLRFSATTVEGFANSTTGAGGISSGNYFIATTPISSISRNSAMSGGAITERITKRDCETACEAKCDTDNTTCYDDCYTTCYSAPTVTARGVCYGTAQHPVYRATTDATPTDDTGTDDTAASVLPAASKETSYNYETVLAGQTSDGTGVGTFGSNIVNITPNTRYYVRAYAVLSDETVVYGNELSFQTSDACFIATAAYGSLLNKHVVLLRTFRDVYLKGNSPGRIFISLYYRFSPAIAEGIAQNEFLKQVVRICLWPWVAFSYIMLHLAIAVKIVLLLSALIGGGAVLFSISTKIKLRISS